MVFKLADVVKNYDMNLNPEAYPVAEFMAHEYPLT